MTQIKNKGMDKKKEEFMSKFVGKPQPYHTEDHQNIQGEYTDRMFNIKDLWSWISTNFVPKEEVEKVKEKIASMKKKPDEEALIVKGMMRLTEGYLSAAAEAVKFHGYNQAIDDILKELQDREI